MTTREYHTLSTVPAPDLSGAAFYPPSAETMDRPSPRFLLFLLALFVLPVSLIPSTQGRFFRIPPFPSAWWTNYLLVLFCFVVLVVRGVGFTRRFHRATFRWFLTPFLMLAAWQALSITWNGQSSDMQRYSLLQTICMAGAITSGACLCSGLSLHSRTWIARGMTIMVAFIVAVYVSLSFGLPGFRPSAAWMDRTTAGLGFTRVFGPLGTATTLNFLLLPALGFSLGMTFIRNWGRWFWLLLTIFFVMSIILTGSRMGVLSLGFFCLLLVLWVRLRAIPLLLPVLVALIGVYAAIGIPERFQHFEDEGRTATYRTGLRAYSSTARGILLGTGHGSLYSKLHDDSLRQLLGETRWYLLSHETDHGYSLRNGHSAIIRAFVETGPIGLLLTIVPLGWLLIKPVTPSFRTVPHLQQTLLRSSLAGCAAVIPAMIVEEFFISAFWVVLLWTIYVVTASEGLATGTNNTGSHS